MKTWLYMKVFWSSTRYWMEATWKYKKISSGSLNGTIMKSSLVSLTSSKPASTVSNSLCRRAMKNNNAFSVPSSSTNRKGKWAPKSSLKKCWSYCNCYVKTATTTSRTISATKCRMTRKMISPASTLSKKQLISWLPWSTTSPSRKTLSPKHVSK